MTGRVATEAGRVDLVVIAVVATPTGTVVSDIGVDCAEPGQYRTFTTSSFAAVEGPYTLEDVVAYPTSVRGAGPQFTLDC